MKLGAINTVFLGEPLGQALAHCRRLGLEYMEVGVGGYTPKTHCDPSARVCWM